MSRRHSLLLLVLVACSRRPAPGPSPVTSADAAIVRHDRPSLPATTAPLDAANGGLLGRKLPRIVYRGGPFLRHPRIVSITFAQDEPKLVAHLEQFGAMITRSNWWHSVTEGYCTNANDCVGDGSGAAPVRLAELLPAELSDSDVDALLRRLDRTGRLGALDANTLLLVYLPKGIALADANARYCSGARAFHRSIELASHRVAYAVLPRCGDEQELTGTASHEILEATTNPFPAERGFAFLPGSEPSGFSAAGLEPVDPCGLITMDSHWTNESGFVVHRAWSNAAAALGHDPCVPSRADRPYVLLVPREPAVRLARVGDTVTVQFDASTVSPVRSWSVSAFDLSGYQAHDRYVALSLDQATVAAGDHVAVSIRSLKSNPQQREIVAIVSTLGVYSYMWPLVVMMR